MTPLQGHQLVLGSGSWVCKWDKGGTGSCPVSTVSPAADTDYTSLQSLRDTAISSLLLVLWDCTPSPYLRPCPHHISPLLRVQGREVSLPDHPEKVLQLPARVGRLNPSLPPVALPFLQGHSQDHWAQEDSWGNPPTPAPSPVWICISPLSSATQAPRDEVTVKPPLPDC